MVLLLVQYIIYHVQNVWELLIGKLCSICKDLARCHTIYVYFYVQWMYSCYYFFLL